MTICLDQLKNRTKQISTEYSDYFNFGGILIIK